jgi:hypothetical protein
MAGWVFLVVMEYEGQILKIKFCQMDSVFSLSKSYNRFTHFRNITNAWSKPP